MTDLAPDELVDDVDALERRDPAGLLRAAAGAGARLRTAVRLHAEVVAEGRDGARATIDAPPAASVDRLVEDGRPRVLVVVGGSDAGVLAGLLTAVLGPSSPVPVVHLREPVLPGWVGAGDLMFAVAGSANGEPGDVAPGLVAESLRRGARVVGIAPTGGSVLAEYIGGAAPMFAALDDGGHADLWSLAVPALSIVDALGLASVPAAVFDGIADRLDQHAERYGPSSTLDGNAAKALAVALVDRIPIVWAGGTAGPAATARFASRLSRDARYPVMTGTFPGVADGQLEVLDGPFASGADADVFRDRVDDPVGGPRLHLVLLRDVDESPAAAAAADAAARRADERGASVTEVRAQGEHPLERFADLVALGDFAAAYLAAVGRS